MSDQEETRQEMPAPDELQPGPPPPEDDEIDWGGDGSDPTEPVRAHVLAALRPTSDPYLPPVDALLTLGDAREQAVQARREALNIGQEQLAELVRMARDRALHSVDEENPAGWAPIHAGELLAELDVSAVADALVPLFDIESDWFSTALPKALGRAGRPALAPLRAYISDRSRWTWGHAHSIGALEAIAEQHPELRDDVVATLSDLLREAERYSDVACTFAMSTLVGLDAVEALPLIRRAFELNKIDEMVRGDWGMILEELGVEPDPDDPLIAESKRRHEERRERLFPREFRERLAALSERRPEPPTVGADRSASRRKQEKARKEKNKRKAAAAARKVNRKRRK